MRFRPQPLAWAVLVAAFLAAAAWLACDYLSRPPAHADARAAAATRPSGQPGPANTGPTDPANLKASGPLNLRKAGQLIEALDIAGTVNVRAANVTLRNFRIDAQGGTYAVRVFPGGSVTLEDGELTNASGAGIYGSDWTARRLNVHHMGSDGLKGGQNIVLEASWLHHLGMAPGAHADGLQLDGGDSVSVRGNHFDLPWYRTEGSQEFRTNACLFINGWAGPITNVTLDANWLNGGNYTIYALKQDGTTVTNNIFGPDSQYGILNGSVQTWSGNRNSSGESIDR